MSSEKEILIQIEHLKKYFPLRNSKKCHVLPLLEQIETPQQGGFAGAGRSDDRDHLAFFHIQIAMIQRHDISMIIFLDQIFDCNDDISVCLHDASSFRYVR